MSLPAKHLHALWQALAAPGLPQYPVRPRLVRVPSTYSTWSLGASHPAPPVRTQRGRLVRVAGTYPTEAPGRTRQLSAARDVHTRYLRSAPAPLDGCHAAAELVTNGGEELLGGILRHPGARRAAVLEPATGCMQRVANPAAGPRPADAPSAGRRRPQPAPTRERHPSLQARPLGPPARNLKPAAGPRRRVFRSVLKLCFLVSPLSQESS